MKRHARRIIRLKKSLAVALTGSVAIIGGCPSIGADTEIARVFRQAYIPGLLEGLSTAVTTPDQTEAGLRRTLTAFFEGVGAVLTPEDARNADN